MRSFSVLALCLGLAACGGSSSPTPTQPIPTSPTPAPTPTPVPESPFKAACGSPSPVLSEMYGYRVKVQLEPTRGKKVLDASPLIKNPQYCAEAGFPGFQYCPTRPEVRPERHACDNYVSGISVKLNVPGPDWFQVVNGQMLSCDGTAPDCALKPDAPYNLDIFAAGTFRACGGRGSNGACGVCNLPSFDPPVRNPAGLCQGGE